MLRNNHKLSHVGQIKAHFSGGSKRVQHPSSHSATRRRRTKYGVITSKNGVFIGLCFFLVSGIALLSQSSGRTSRSSSFVQSYATASSSRRDDRQLRQPETVSTADVDVFIIGTGPAGLTAALFASRIGLSVLATGSLSSSQLAEAATLDNFPSWSATTNGGQDWLTNMQHQAAASGGQLQFAQSGLMVSDMQHDQNLLFTIRVEEKYKITSRSVILATGSRSRRLELPHEDTLWGKSIHSCAICDGPSYTSGVVVVVGGGDAAVEAALLLAKHADTTVILVHRRTSFRATDQQNLSTLQQTRNIHLMTPYQVLEYTISGATKADLTGVVLEHVETTEKKNVPCDGVFVMIGSEPRSSLVKDLVSLDSETGLVALANGEAATATSLPGLFAAGEVADNRYKQAITAAASGAQAAMDAERWLRSVKETVSTRKPNLQLPLEHIETTQSKIQREVEEALPGKRQSSQATSTSEYKCPDLTKEECITALVNSYPVVVFAKSWCGACKRALEKLAIEGVSKDPYLHVVDLDQMTDFRKIQTTLEAMTGRRTVPNVFIGGKNIGGGDETTALHRSGELRPLLEKAKALPGGVELCDLKEEACISFVVQKYPVVVFSKSYCPYCKRALEALKQEGLTGEPSLRVIELTALDNGSAVQSTLKKMTGRRTVPNVFVGGTSIGGGDETTALHRAGKLTELLRDARAFEGKTLIAI